MALIEWKDSYALGVPSVDLEHRQLIDLINELHEKLCREREAPSTVVEFLGELVTRVGAHFALEERLMRTSDYPDYPAHKADHERLLDEIRDLMDDYEDRLHPDLAAFAASLDTWFTAHFRSHDAKLHGKVR